MKNGIWNINGNKLLLTTFEKNIKYNLNSSFDSNFDSIILIDSKDLDANFLNFKILEKDGSISQMCGNLLILFAYHSYQTKFKIPLFKNKRFSGAQIIVTPFPKYFTDNNFKFFLYHALGEPHFVTFIKSKNSIPSLKTCLSLSKKYNSNLTFIYFYHSKLYFHNSKLYYQTFERGVNQFTLSCGTGCASAIYFLKSKFLMNPHKIYCPGGVYYTSSFHNKVNICVKNSKIKFIHTI